MRKYVFPSKRIPTTSVFSCIYYYSTSAAPETTAMNIILFSRNFVVDVFFSLSSSYLLLPTDDDFIPTPFGRTTRRRPESLLLLLLLITTPPPITGQSAAASSFQIEIAAGIVYFSHARRYRRGVTSATINDVSVNNIARRDAASSFRAVGNVVTFGELSCTRRITWRRFVVP